MKRNLIVVEDFYDDPGEVRKYALECKWFNPHQSGWGSDYMEDKEINNWFSTYSKDRYVTDEVITKIEKSIKSKIDVEHFKYIPTSNNFNSYKESTGTVWNAGFHSRLAPPNINEGNKGIHQHSGDDWNHAGEDDWVGVLFMTPPEITKDYPNYRNHGFDIWENIKFNTMGVYHGRDSEPYLNKYGTMSFKKNQVNWKWDEQPIPPIVSDNEDWYMTTRIQFKYNTLVLHRGTNFHDGNVGWGDTIENSRMVQLFFFREDKYNNDNSR